MRVEDGMWVEDECELCHRPGHTLRSCPTRDDEYDEYDEEEDDEEEDEWT